MKILMLAPIPPPSGGIATWAVRYREYCKHHNKNLEIVNVSIRGKRAKQENSKVNLFDEIIRTCGIICRLKKALKTFKPDLVHLNTSCSPFGTVRDALLLKICKKNCPVVVHCHCNINDQLKGKLAVKAFRYMVLNAIKVIVLNEPSKNYVEDIQNGKSIYIPNFIKDNAIAKEHKINSEILKAVSVGHIEASKGLYEILDAARINPEIEFVLVGAAREEISKESFPANVTLTGRVSIDEVQHYLDNSDVFLFPTKTEGFSNALLEAMARGIPCVTTDVGANKLMLEDKGGIVLEDCNGKSITEAFEKIKSPEIRKAMSDWNIKKVEKSYQSSIVMEQYFDLYASITEK